MTHFLWLELRRYPTTMFHFAAMTAASLLAALYFFAFIGRFDGSADSAMFRSYPPVIALGLTICLYVVVIYGAVIYARFVVSDYIGNRRIQLYTYPGGRSPLFVAKSAAYVIVTSAAAFAGIVLAGALFFIGETFAPVVSAGGGALGPLSMTIGTGLISVILLAASIVMIAGVIGVFRRSTIATIVSAIILIALLGNGVAISLANTAWLTGVVALSCAVLAAGAVAVQAKRIQDDEIL